MRHDMYYILADQLNEHRGLPVKPLPALPMAGAIEGGWNRSAVTFTNGTLTKIRIEPVSIVATLGSAAAITSISEALSVNVRDFCTTEV
jgi:hypothetical protein